MAPEKLSGGPRLRVMKPRGGPGSGRPTATAWTMISRTVSGDSAEGSVEPAGRRRRAPGGIARGSPSRGTDSDPTGSRRSRYLSHRYQSVNGVVLAGAMATLPTNSMERRAARFGCSDGSMTGRVINVHITPEQRARLFDAYVKQRNLVERSGGGNLQDDFICKG